MSFYFYIIYSSSLDKFYVGECENVELRLEQHNSHFFEGSYTARATDWVFVYIKALENRTKTRKLETFIKSMKSKKFIKQFIIDEDLQNSVLIKLFRD